MLHTRLSAFLNPGKILLAPFGAFILILAGCGNREPATPINFQLVTQIDLIIPNGFAGGICIEPATAPTGLKETSRVTAKVSKDGKCPSGEAPARGNSANIGMVHFESGKAIKFISYTAGSKDGSFALRETDIVGREGHWLFLGTKSEWLKFMSEGGRKLGKVR